MEIDHKGIRQLLLSPLFLFEQLVGVLLPGVLLTLVLSFKGNSTIKTVWLTAPFGYKTKIAVALLLAYVVGTVLRLPVAILQPFLRPFVASQMPPDNFQVQNPDIRKMLTAAVSDGVVLATPGLVDRLSLEKADTAFHFVTGMALFVGGCVPGDGSLRWLELGVGLAMISFGVWKAKQYQEQVLQTVGIGWANIIGRMTPEQFRLAASIAQGLNTAGKNTGVRLPDVRPQPTAEKQATVAKG